jgi:hypothetical protein
MAAFFIDLDDTLVKHRTTELLDGALETLQQIKAKGHQIFITTRRGDDWSFPHVYSKRATEAFLKSLNISFDGVIFNVESPRVIINDAGAIGVNHPAASPFKYVIGDDDNPIAIK